MAGNQRSDCRAETIEDDVGKTRIPSWHDDLQQLDKNRKNESEKHRSRKRPRVPPGCQTERHEQAEIENPIREPPASDRNIERERQGRPVLHWREREDQNTEQDGYGYNCPKCRP